MEIIKSKGLAEDKILILQVKEIWRIEFTDFGPLQNRDTSL